jgi:hypothetical protein
MALNFGTGTRLIDASPWLRNQAERHERILRVAECNSVIEGLPPFQDETRARIAAELSAIAQALAPEPTGSPPPSDDSSS